MAKRVATPGVYVVEKTSFGKSSVALPTAIPVFIGYTQKAVREGKSLVNTPFPINSLKDYKTYFGGSTQHQFEIAPVETGEFDIEVNSIKYMLKPASTRFLLYDSLRFYFANGGSTAFIISVGQYLNNKGEANRVVKSDLLKGLKAAELQPEPTLTVIPDLMNLDAGAAADIQQQMMIQAAKLQDRFAILDVANGDKERTLMDNDVITQFREKVGVDSLAFGAAYYPWVNTTVVDADELNFTNVVNKEVLIEVLSQEAEAIYTNKRKVEDIKAELAKMLDENASVSSLDKTLKVVCPSYVTLLKRLEKKLNVLPPSGGLAGLYARIDDSRGVWKAPANESLVSVVSPAVMLSNEEQEDLNVTVSGKSVNAIRHFAGEGTLVWGARTLDGNSQDWKYINVRRTLTYIEQSVKNTARSFVFEPNSSSTWVSIKASISNFLTGLWQQGGLAGGAAAQAYEVAVGLGTSMTSEDILEGIMRVNVKVALLRPAEFIIITFEQKMQEAGGGEEEGGGDEGGGEE